MRGDERPEIIILIIFFKKLLTNCNIRCIMNVQSQGWLFIFDLLYASIGVEF